MTRQQAFAKLQKLFGKQAAYRVAKEITSPEKREAALVKLREVRERKADLNGKLDAKRRELLSDPAYVALLEESKTLNKEVSTLQGEASHYRFAAGYANSFAFHVEAEGDTWEEVFEKLDEKKKTSKAASAQQISKDT